MGRAPSPAPDPLVRQFFHKNSALFGKGAIAVESGSVLAKERVAGCTLNWTRESEVEIPGQDLPVWSLLKIRHAMGAVPFLLAVGALPALAQTLPAYCGAVGAKSYTPPVVTIPAVTLNRGPVITVTNATVVVNGDTSS